MKYLLTILLLLCVGCGGSGGGGGGTVPTDDYTKIITVDALDIQTLVDVNFGVEIDCYFVIDTENNTYTVTEDVFFAVSVGNTYKIWTNDKMNIYMVEEVE